MPKIETYICDCGCARQKDQSNHWWQVMIQPGRVLELRPLGDRLLPDFKVAAGQECVVKMVNRFLSKEDCNAHSQDPRGSRSASSADV